MRFQGLFSALALSVAAAIPAAAHAHSVEPITPTFPEHNQHGDGDWEQTEGTLSQKDRLNKNLEGSDYAFADIHKSGKSFLDEWSFTLADAGNVTINLFDFTLPGTSSNFLSQNSDDNNGHKGKNDWSKNGQGKTNFTNLFDNKFLTVSLFDHDGSLLGTAGENGTLSVLGLAANEWYTLTVSGKAVGLLGGVYHGDLNVAPVPLGDTLPLLGSALAILALNKRRSSKSLSRNVLSA